jgi:hypothetical protein
MVGLGRMGGNGFVVYLERSEKSLPVRRHPWDVQRNREEGARIES